MPIVPPEQMQRPTETLCDGCHSANYDIRTKAVTEWNVGCEKCHGAGGAHIKTQGAGPIVNPARLDGVRADDVCIQCHSQGQPRHNPIEGRYYDWPVGYQPGDRLADFWHLEPHRLGEESFTHWADGTAHKNRMQGNDYVQSQMHLKGVRCYACHDTHGTKHEADLRLPGNAVCTQCHNGVMQPGPTGTLEFHTQHKADSEGSKCVACHMPAIAQTIGDVNVRSHTFEDAVFRAGFARASSSPAWPACSCYSRPATTADAWCSSTSWVSLLGQVGKVPFVRRRGSRGAVLEEDPGRRRVIGEPGRAPQWTLAAGPGSLPPAARPKPTRAVKRCLVTCWVPARCVRRGCDEPEWRCDRRSGGRHALPAARSRRAEVGA